VKRYTSEYEGASEISMRVSRDDRDLVFLSPTMAEDSIDAQPRQKPVCGIWPIASPR
jgi:hypothetical protein